MTYESRVALGLALLALLVPATSLTTACDIGGCLSEPTDAYGSDVALVSIDAATTTEVPLDLSFPADGATDSVWVDFVLRGCGETPLDGEYRILRADGAELARGSMSIWCIPDANRSGGGFPEELPSTEFDCTSGTRCTASFRLVLAPTETRGDLELEATLNRPGAGYCGPETVRTDAQIDAWGAP